MTTLKYRTLNGYLPVTFADFIDSTRRNRKNENAFIPPVDIFKDDKEIEIRVTAPGMKKEDFTINLDGDQLVISGERTLDENMQANIQKKENLYGQFARAFTLSDKVDKDKIAARYQDGILILQIPLLEKKEKSVIKVA